MTDFERLIGASGKGNVDEVRAFFVTTLNSSTKKTRRGRPRFIMQPSADIVLSFRSW